MFGHVAGRQRRWPWVILSFLLALAFAGSFADTGEGINDWGILRLGSAVGLGISLLGLILTIRRRRRAEQDGERRSEGDDGAEGRPPTEEPARTYEEVFGLPLDIPLDREEERVPDAPEEGPPGDEEATMQAEGQPPAEQPPTEEPAPASEEDLQPQSADLDGDQGKVPVADEVEFQDHLRRMREELKARAEEAALRIKQREAELHEAASSAPDPQR